MAPSFFFRRGSHAQRSVITASCCLPAACVLAAHGDVCCACSLPLRACVPSSSSTSSTGAATLDDRASQASAQPSRTPPAASGRSSSDQAPLVALLSPFNALIAECGATKDCDTRRLLFLLDAFVHGAPCPCGQPLEATCPRLSPLRPLQLPSTCPPPGAACEPARRAPRGHTNSSPRRDWLRAATLPKTASLPANGPAERGNIKACLGRPRSHLQSKALGAGASNFISPAARDTAHLHARLACACACVLPVCTVHTRCLQPPALTHRLSAT